MSQATHTYRCEIDFLAGLGAFVEDELIARFGDRVRLRTGLRPDALAFDYMGALAALLELRSATAVSLVQRFDVPRPKALLGHQHFITLLAMIATARGLWRAGSFTTLRLSAAGDESSVMARLKHELEQGTGLRPDPLEGDLLLRFRRVPDGWEALVRLSPRPLATRPWRVCNFPGALNATLAHAMAELTRPQPSDRVLNIACGSATLLVERLALAPAQEAIGCDIDSAALDCADANLGAAAGHEFAHGQPVRLEQWDAGALPLPGASIDVILGDLPFGQLIGSHEGNLQLYPRIFAAAARVAVPGARMALVTHEVRLLEQVADDFRAMWRLDTLLPVRSSGMTPRVYLLLREP